MSRLPAKWCLALIRRSYLGTILVWGPSMIGVECLVSTMFRTLILSLTLMGMMTAPLLAQPIPSAPTPGQKPPIPEPSPGSKPPIPEPPKGPPHKPDAPGVKSTTVVVDINKASAAELQQVKGIGKSTANKIIAGRPYTVLDDLITKKVFSQKQLDKFKTQLTVGK